MQCKRCQMQGQCWSQYQDRCIECSPTQASIPCENKFGCVNPNGGEFQNTPPVDPMHSNCNPCWNSNKFTTF